MLLNTYEKKAKARKTHFGIEGTMKMRNYERDYAEKRKRKSLTNPSGTFKELVIFPRQGGGVMFYIDS